MARRKTNPSLSKIGAYPMNEYQLIQTLFPNVPNLFETDASLIEINGEKWNMSCDSFSLEEDLFTDDNPYQPGHNFVVATLSDLIATGYQPIFYQHTLTLSPQYNDEWNKLLATGISDTLKKYNTLLIGGDMGQSQYFAYTGIGLGKQIQNISRHIPNKKQHPKHISKKKTVPNIPLLKQLFKQHKYGYGTGSVSLYAGLPDLHKILEQKIAQFYQTEDAIIFPNGYTTNIGIITALCQKGDVIINDSVNHTSIFDSSYLLGTELKIYPHNDMKQLEKILSRIPDTQTDRFIITDGAFLCMVI